MEEGTFIGIWNIRWPTFGEIVTDEGHKLRSSEEDARYKRDVTFLVLNEMM